MGRGRRVSFCERTLATYLEVAHRPSPRPSHTCGLMRPSARKPTRGEGGWIETRGERGSLECEYTRGGAV